MGQVIGGEDLINSLLDLRKNSPDGYYKFSTEKRDTVIIFSPELINEVLVNKQKSFSRGIVFIKMKNFFGNGLIVSEDPEHIKNKRIMQKSFSKKSIEEYKNVIRNECLESLNKIDGKQFSLSELSDSLAFNCVSKCFIGENIPEEYISIYHEISYKISNISKLKFSYEETKSFAPLKNFINNMVIQTNVEDNLLWSMINSEMDTDQIVDEVITTLGAGFETTSALISWTLINLNNNKEFIKKYRKNPSQKMINNFIKETLRTNPPAYFTTRTAKEDINLLGIEIKEGTNIFISQYVTQRDPLYYDNPDSWVPDRWTESFEKSLPRGSFFPFGMGSKKCIGEHFAIMVATIFLSNFLDSYDFDILEKNIKPKYLVSMIPDSPVMTITNNLFDSCSNC